jgi:predicted RNase H-like HicB family nuclease
MNRKAIMATAVCYWSEENDGYVVISPLFESIAGTGDTKPEAMEVFENQLQDAYEAYLEGRVPKDRRGRPSKNQVALNVDVNPDTKEMIKELAARIDCSQGEVVDFLTMLYDKTMSAESRNEQTELARSHSYEKLLVSLAQVNEEIAKFNQNQPEHLGCGHKFAKAMVGLTCTICGTAKKKGKSTKSKELNNR